MNIEIRYKDNLYDVDAKGKERIIKRNVVFRNFVDVEDITLIAHKWTKKGIIDPKKCVIVHKDLGEKVLDMPYEELVHYKEYKPIRVKGFKRYD